MVVENQEFDRRIFAVFLFFLILSLTSIFQFVILSNQFTSLQSSIQVSDMTGSFHGTVYDENGDIIEYIHIHNNMTDFGRDNFIRWKLFNDSFTEGPIKYMSVGLGNDEDGDASNNLGLVEEFIIVEGEYYDPAPGFWGVNASFDFFGLNTITEAGLLTRPAGGILVFYVNSLNISVAYGWTLNVCWKGKISGT